MYPMLLAAASKIDVGKFIKTIVIIIAIILGIWFLRKFLKRRKNEAAIKDLAKDIDKNQISYPQSYYGIWAGEIYQALDKWNDDEDAVYNVIRKLKTKDDVLQLITAFGVKDDMTLSQWIIDQLNSEERAVMNRLLTDKNINYQF